MSNSTTLIDTVSQSQSQKEVTVNAALDAASQAMIFGRRASSTSALTWGYYGGRFTKGNGTTIAVSNGTLALTASVTNYIEVDSVGAISVNSSGFTAGRIALYAVVTGTSTVTSYTDYRDGTQGNFSILTALSATADGDKGDIVISGGSTVMTIDNGAVTYAKFQNVSATDKILGRASSGAGVVEEISCTAAGRSLIAGANAAAQRTTLGLGTSATIDIDTDTTLAANSDTKIATQKAVKAYADALIAANDAMVFKGSTDCSTNPNYPAADRGHTYRVSVAGKIGGASGVNVEVGDMFICLTDGTSSGDQATVGSSWNIIQVNLDGAVIGPASSTNNHLCLFNGTTGKVIQDASLSSVLDQISSTQGAILFRGASAWTALAAGTNGQALRTQGAGADPQWASAPFNLSLFYPGAPTAGALVGILAAPAGITTITFAAAISGSSGKALTAATAQTDFDVRKNATTSSNGSSVGTVRFAASGDVPTFIAASGFSLTGGTDYLTVWAPSTPDATLANIGISLFGTR